MKLQTEILSYLIFTTIVLSLSSLSIYYFFSFHETFSKYMNRLNAYFIVNVFETPTIMFNSVCEFCKVEISFQINHSKPLEQIFVIETLSDGREIRARYEEIRSRESLNSTILNLNKVFNLYLSAISTEKIVFSLDKPARTISAKNV